MDFPILDTTHALVVYWVNIDELAVVTFEKDTPKIKMETCLAIFGWHQISLQLHLTCGQIEVIGVF